MSVSYRNGLRAALLYLLLSLVWLQFSGYLLSSFFDEFSDRAHWQLVGGYAWAVVSAVPVSYTHLTLPTICSV